MKLTKAQQRSYHRSTMTPIPEDEYPPHYLFSGNRSKSKAELDFMRQYYRDYAHTLKRLLRKYRFAYQALMAGEKELDLSRRLVKKRDRIAEQLVKTPPSKRRGLVWRESIMDLVDHHEPAE